MKSLTHTPSQNTPSSRVAIKPLRHVFWAGALSLLGACGGVDDGSIGNASEVVLVAGSQTVVPGTIETTQNLLQTMSWKISPVTPFSPMLLLGNADCAVADKTDRIYPAPSNATGSTVHGGSTWRCVLTVTSFTSSNTENLYELLLTGTDELGRHITYSKTLRVTPNF